MVEPSTETERLKYERMWRDFPDYRMNSPGELVLLKWLGIVKPKPGASIIDFGCGPGRASMVMGLMGFKVTMVDIADNCLDPDVRDLVNHGRLRFEVGDFTAQYPAAVFVNGNGVTEAFETYALADHAYCCDVMEHIPPERVDRAIINILGAVRDAFFLVNFRDDHFGADAGEPLHLTVRPFPWWRDKFREHGTLVEARDLIVNGMFRVTR